MTPTPRPANATTPDPRLAEPDTDRSATMSLNPLNPPLPLGAPMAGAPADDGVALAPVLAEPLALALATEPPAGGALRSRLLARAAASRQAEQGMVTARRRRLPHRALADGVTVQALYAAPADRALRPGEPLRVRLFELAEGALLPAALLADAAGGGAADHGGPCQREWLVLQGAVAADGLALAARDYHVVPAGQPQPAWRCRAAALLFLRESAPLPGSAGEPASTVRDAEAGWPDFAPGIRRRVLWQRQGQAALLYHADPGAQVPRHTHGHDEECLMVQGELFLDDLLLQAGDYQLAPAGTGHRITATDTGVVIYAHGDLDLRFVDA